MSNMTAGGPSYGIFDVLFGNKPKEEPKDGKEFGPLLDLVKALNGESSDKDAQGVGRTDKETEAGKRAEEYRHVIAPAMMAAFSQNADMEKVLAAQEGSLQLSPAQLKQLMMANQSGKVPAPLKAVEQQDGISELLSQMTEVAEEPVDLGQVAKGKVPKLAPEVKLTPEMQQVLAEHPQLQERLEASIDSRIQQLATELAKRQESQKSIAGLMEKAALAGGGVEAIQTDAVQKQLNPKVSKAANEKMFTTEDFLQMKETGAQKAELQANATQTQKAVLPAEQSDIGSKPKSEFAELLQQSASGVKSKSNLADLKKELDVSQMPLPTDLALKGSAAMAVREVFITEGKPEVVRERLVGEVADSVGIQAKAGGGEMKLVIHPENMGELKLKVGAKDGKVEVAVTADNNDVAKTLRASQSDLREALSDQHLTLSKFEVHVAKDSSMASNQDNGSNFQNQFFQDNGDSKSNSGTFADHNDRNTSSSRQDVDIPAKDVSIGKPRLASQGPYRTANGGGARLDVVA